MGVRATQVMLYKRVINVDYVLLFSHFEQIWSSHSAWVVLTMQF